MKTQEVKGNRAPREKDPTWRRRSLGYKKSWGTGSAKWRKTRKRSGRKGKTFALESSGVEKGLKVEVFRTKKHRKIQHLVQRIKKMELKYQIKTTKEGEKG